MSHLPSHSSPLAYTSSRPTTLSDNTLSRTRQAETSLRQLSESLTRIREVRRSILELSSEIHQSHTASTMDPGHDSIALTDSSHSVPRADSTGITAMNVDAEPLRFVRTQDVLNEIEGRFASPYSGAIDMPSGTEQPQTFPPSQTWQIVHREAVRARDHTNAPISRPVDLPPLNTTILPYPSTPANTAENSTPSAAPQQARQQWARPSVPVESLVNRPRRDASDDPSTFLGRRIAAREAAASAAGSSGTSSSLLADIQHRTAAQARRLAELHADFVRFRSQMRTRRTEASHSSSLDSDSASTRSSEVQTRTLDSPASPAGRSPLSAIARRFRYSRDRDRAETRQSSGQSSQSGRLSLLSNVSIQNLASPMSAASSNGPILFDEPMSYDDGLPRFQSDEPQQGRSYIITRRLNADGEEYVHNIALSGDDGYGLESWLGHENQPLRVVLRRQGAAPSDATATDDTSRSRGWVRLDRDGNEISAEEEAELENQRTEYRLQAHMQYSMQLQAENDGLSQDGSLNNHNNRLIASTRTAFPQQQNEANHPRVRLSSNHPRAPRMYYGSVMDSVMAINDSSRRPSTTDLLGPQDKNVIGSSAPFEPSILPTPLADMVPSRPSRRPCNQPILVQGRVFAGR